MSNPHHLSTDTDGRPYVADSGNGRVLIFGSVQNLPPAGATAAFPLTSGSAEGIFVNSNTGEIWVTDASNAVRKYPRYDQLIFTAPPFYNLSIPSILPIAVAQDQYGDLIVAEAVNRVTFYYPQLY